MLAQSTGAERLNFGSIFYIEFDCKCVARSVIPITTKSKIRGRPRLGTWFGESGCAKRVSVVLPRWNKSMH